MAGSCFAAKVKIFSSVHSSPSPLALFLNRSTRMRPLSLSTDRPHSLHIHAASPLNVKLSADESCSHDVTLFRWQICLEICQLSRVRLPGAYGVLVY